NRPWVNSYLFPWDFEGWRQKSKESIDLKSYPPHTAAADILRTKTGVVASAAEWENRASEIRKSITWMLGDEPELMPPSAGGGGRGGPPPGAGRGGPNPGQVTPDLVRWVIQRGGNSFGWLEPQKSRTASKSVAFRYNVRGDLYYSADAPE